MSMVFSALPIIPTVLKILFVAFLNFFLRFLTVKMRLSPPELSYLYTSLTSNPPLRPHLRSLTQYRPYSIQTDFLSTANGSARITWGTGQQGGDVFVVVKAQIDDSVELPNGLQGGQVSIDVTGINAN